MPQCVSSRSIRRPSSYTRGAPPMRSAIHSRGFESAGRSERRTCTPRSRIRSCSRHRRGACWSGPMAWRRRGRRIRWRWRKRRRRSGSSASMRTRARPRRIAAFSRRSPAPACRADSCSGPTSTERRSFLRSSMSATTASRSRSPVPSGRIPSRSKAWRPATISWSTPASKRARRMRWRSHSPTRSCRDIASSCSRAPPR